LFEMENLFDNQHLGDHFAGREAEALDVDFVLADLHELGEVGIDVHAEDGKVLYTCTLVLRTADGSIVVTAESVLGAALGCLLETLLVLHDESDRGIAAIEDFLGGDAA
jgi:hypothetical protein